MYISERLTLLEYKRLKYIKKTVSVVQNKTPFNPNTLLVHSHLQI